MRTTSGSAEGDWAFVRVADWLTQSAGVRREEISPESLLSFYNVDSLDFTSLLMELEDEFELPLPEPALRIMTVGDLVEWLRSAKR